MESRQQVDNEDDSLEIIYPDIELQPKSWSIREYIDKQLRSPCQRMAIINGAQLSLIALFICSLTTRIRRWMPVATGAYIVGSSISFVYCLSTKEAQTAFMLRDVKKEMAEKRMIDDEQSTK
jgi:hypothetical protein